MSAARPPTACLCHVVRFLQLLSRHWWVFDADSLLLGHIWPTAGNWHEYHSHRCFPKNYVAVYFTIDSNDSNVRRKCVWDSGALAISRCPLRCWQIFRILLLFHWLPHAVDIRFPLSSSSSFAVNHPGQCNGFQLILSHNMTRKSDLPANSHLQEISWRVGSLKYLFITCTCYVCRNFSKLAAIKNIYIFTIMVAENKKSKRLNK